MARPLACMATIADVMEIAAVLDRWRGLELAGLSELPLDVPMRTTLGGRVEERRKLYGEFGLVNLVALIPSIATQRRASS